jgi:hypothetical protein
METIAPKILLNLKAGWLIKNCQPALSNINSQKSLLK